MTLDRIRKRHIIATAIIAGLKITFVARQLGVSRSWASREANSAGIRNIIGDLIRANIEKVRQVFREALDVIQQAFQARKIYVRKGRIIQGGPDHMVRLEAVTVFINLLMAAEPYGIA
jgi:hypothetical protein